MSAFCEHNRPGRTCWVCHPDHRTWQDWQRMEPFVPDHAPGIPRRQLAAAARLSVTRAEDAVAAYRDNFPVVALHSIRRGRDAGYWRSNIMDDLRFCWADYVISRETSFHRFWSGQYLPALVADGRPAHEIEAVERSFRHFMEDLQGLGGPIVTA